MYRMINWKRYQSRRGASASSRDRILPHFKGITKARTYSYCVHCDKGFDHHRTREGSDWRMEGEGIMWLSSWRNRKESEKQHSPLLPFLTNPSLWLSLWLISLASISFHFSPRSVVFPLPFGSSLFLTQFSMNQSRVGVEQKEGWKQKETERSLSSWLMEEEADMIEHPSVSSLLILSSPSFHRASVSSASTLHPQTPISDIRRNLFHPVVKFIPFLCRCSEKICVLLLFALCVVVVFLSFCSDSLFSPVDLSIRFIRT